MSAPRKRNADAGTSADSQNTQQGNSTLDPTPAPAALQGRPYTVIVDGGRRRVWGRYRTKDDALAALRALHRHGFAAHVELVGKDWGGS